MVSQTDTDLDTSGDKDAGSSLLDDQTKEILEMLERDPFLDIEKPPVEMRKAFDTFYAKIGYPSLEVAQVEDKDIPGAAGSIVVRIYHPIGSVGETTPVLVFFFGGGMVMGSIDAYDGLCRRLCAKSGCIIVSGSYRLSPENKFPAAVEDAVAVFNWAYDNAQSYGGDQTRIAVGGESGGGNLAAVLTQTMRNDPQRHITFQLLINPAIGTRGDTASMKEYASGYFFEPDALDWIYEQYLDDDTNVENPRVSPLFAESFEGLPEAFIVIAGCDILRDDIVEYAEKLKQAGVAVETSTYEGTIHGFTVMAGIVDAGALAIDECAQKMKAALVQ